MEGSTLISSSLGLAVLAAAQLLSNRQIRKLQTKVTGPFWKESPTVEPEKNER